MSERLEEASPEVVAELARHGVDTAGKLAGRVRKLEAELEKARAGAVEAPMGCSLLFVERDEYGSKVVHDLSSAAFETGGVELLISNATPSIRLHVMLAHVRNAVPLLENALKRKQDNP